MRAALVQLCSGDDPDANLPVTERLIREAATGGATLVATPEVTNMVSASRARIRCGRFALAVGTMARAWGGTLSPTGSIFSIVRTIAITFPS